MAAKKYSFVFWAIKLDSLASLARTKYTRIFFWPQFMHLPYTLVFAILKCAIKKDYNNYFELLPTLTMLLEILIEKMFIDCS